MGERRAHADALYAGGRYAEAGEEYRALANDSAQADPTARNALLVAAAECDLKTKRLSKEQVDALPDTQDESGARRMYLAVELARNKDDGSAQQSLVSQMEQRFPDSPWLAEALYTSGNMYLLRKDYPQAIVYYGELAKRFPEPSLCAQQPLEGSVAELSSGKLLRSSAALRQADCALSGRQGDSRGSVLARAPVRRPGASAGDGRGLLPDRLPSLRALLLCPDGARPVGGDWAR